MTKNILVTGAAGFIGSEFVADRVEKGDNVIVLDALTYAGKRENLDWIDEQNWPGKYKLIVGNVCNTELVSHLLQENNIEWVVHYAAESHVDLSITNPEPFLKSNIMGTYSMLQASLSYYKSLNAEQKKDFRFHHISTDEVYGDFDVDSKEMFNEISPYKPSNPYSATKAGSDCLVIAWVRTYGLPATISNCSNNYGPRQLDEKLMPKIVRAAFEGKPLTIHGDGRNIRDWIHVEDHNDGVSLILTKGKIGETYCMGGNGERSNKYVITTIAELMDEMYPKKDGKSYTEQIVYTEDRIGNDRRYALDPTKIETELGWKRKYDNFEDGLRETIKWYVKYWKNKKR